MFWLKKFFAPFLFPLSFALACGCAGIALSLSRRWRRTGWCLLAASVIILLATGNKWISGRLISPLESYYPAVGGCESGRPLPAALADCQYVVVLGCGHFDATDRPALSRLSASARARLVEAVRLLRLLPAARLVVSGPADHGGVPHARVLAEAAASLGVEPNRIQMIDDARDTGEEAARIGQVIGDVPFALVTSAWHLPRAMALCNAQGLHALPCPTDYLYCIPYSWRLSDFTWDVESLARSTAAVHERLGLWWLRLRGKG